MHEVVILRGVARFFSSGGAYVILSSRYTARSVSPAPGCHPAQVPVHVPSAVEAPHPGPPMSQSSTRPQDPGPSRHQAPPFPAPAPQRRAKTAQRERCQQGPHIRYYKRPHTPLSRRTSLKDIAATFITHFVRLGDLVVNFVKDQVGRNPVGHGGCSSLVSTPPTR